jgi:hypothetical protein
VLQGMWVTISKEYAVSILRTQERKDKYECNLLQLLVQTFQTL